MRRPGLDAACLAVREADLPLYEAHDLHGFYLGEEAILRCDTFSLAGSLHLHHELFGVVLMLVNGTLGFAVDTVRPWFGHG